MHLQPRKNPRPQSAAPKLQTGIYSAYGFLPDRVEGRNPSPGARKIFAMPKESGQRPKSAEHHQLQHQHGETILASSPIEMAPVYRIAMGTPPFGLEPNSSQPAARLVTVQSEFKRTSGSKVAQLQVQKLARLEAELGQTREELERAQGRADRAEARGEELGHAVRDLKEQLGVRAWALSEKARALKEAEEHNERIVLEGEAALEGLQQQCEAAEREGHQWQQRAHQTAEALEEAKAITFPSPHKTHVGVGASTAPKLASAHR